MRAVTAIALLSLLGCREDPGEPDYSGLAVIFDRASEGQGEGDLLPGPDPYVEGEDRLSLGQFYEGDYSEIVPLGPGVNYFIFLAGEALTYSSQSDSDRVEGLQSDRITLAGLGFWGGGIIWDQTRDLTDWSTLSVSLKSNDLDNVNITVGSQGNEVAVSAADYGYAADGEWYNLTIPLSDFVDGGVDLSAIRVAFAIGGGAESAGAQILLDNVYME